MFLEPHFGSQRSGWIEVICGAMFSGKTEELIRRLKRAQYAGQKTMVFKPVTDQRYEEAYVTSHDRNSLESITLDHSEALQHVDSDIQVVGIDEAQFFDDELPHACEALALTGVRVIVAGLDMDYEGKPFGPMPNLLAVAEYITKVHPICPHCGNLATHSYRLIAERSQVLLGEIGVYEPRCRKCFDMGNILNLNG
ncbi:MAG: thymidine kinase [Saprospiraceae bacterium]|nr:thymidine kinase [Saprospiraceae bacterium]